MGAACGLKKPVVLLNPTLVRRNEHGYPSSPYLMAAFTTAFAADTQAVRFPEPRRWPAQAAAPEAATTGAAADRSRGGAYQALSPPSASPGAASGSARGWGGGGARPSGSCAVLRRWPRGWEAFFVDDSPVRRPARLRAVCIVHFPEFCAVGVFLKSRRWDPPPRPIAPPPNPYRNRPSVLALQNNAATAGQGYVFLGEFPEEPSAAVLEARLVAALPAQAAAPAEAAAAAVAAGSYNRTSWAGVLP